ncbi:MAG: hypothetical protein MR006_00060, partial [Arcanobacterium sp.]|nr:hypothetical protein [Arcanobacterium sp.]
QTKLLEGILPWLAAMGTRVTFLTATMPSWQRDVLIRAYSGGSSKQELPAPLFPSAETVAPASGDVPVVTPIAMEPETVEFRVEYAPAEAVVERHVSWVHEARQRWPLARIGVMCNTVGRARAVARELASTGEQPLLLHSQMTARHRQLMADRLLREIGKGGAGAGLTVVGTQIIEASLDIDLDLLDTEICPAPARIQRAGRVWRRSDPRRSMRVPQLDAKQIQVLNFVDSGNNAAVLPYLLAELRNTAQFLERSRTLRFPNEVQDFVDSAAVSIADIADDADLEAMADYVQQLQHATDRRVNLKEIFSDDADTFHFSQLTDGGVPEESATRLIEEARSWRVIAGGDPTVIPGGWSGTLRDLEQIASCDTESLRAALLASAPLSGTLQSALLAAGAQQIRAKTVLGRYWYLPEAERFYDPLLGFDVAALKAASKS